LPAQRLHSIHQAEQAGAGPDVCSPDAVVDDLDDDRAGTVE
jgi:hypothetical protein